MVNVVQKLYETCKEAFVEGETGFVPPLAKLERIQSILDSMKAEDVNLSPNNPYFNGSSETEQVPQITYLHIYECDQFSIGIFCLPAFGVIPLHNHPGMTVFSKLLFGSMHITSYDWVPNHMPISSTTGGRNWRLAKKHVDSEFRAPCNTSILYPAACGNMHCFKALTACAVLDVLGPPYSKEQGRTCTYFHHQPHPISGVEHLPTEDKKEYAWLGEKEKPEDFIVVGAMYEGPIIVEN